MWHQEMTPRAVYRGAVSCGRVFCPHHVEPCFSKWSQAIFHVTADAHPRIAGQTEKMDERSNSVMSSTRQRE